MKPVRTRFSPSPTGALHLGGAHTALFNWLYARHYQGVFILRIEDTDLERSEERFVEEIKESLTWLGLGWDEGPYRQSERLHLYREYAGRLLEAGKAYYCDCDPEELEVRRKAALARGEKPKYDGRCRERQLERGPGTALRFKTPQRGTTVWQDGIKGAIAFENKELDDLVILRADGIPTYNFAVVVDDLTMDITQVIRGDDHIPNTPRQLVIYQALGVKPPQFAHMPLMLAKDRGKLSKRRGALPVLHYRRQGFLPHTLNNYLARLAWSHGDQEIFTPEELIRYFTLEHVGKSPGVHDEEKLLWLNGHYLKGESLPVLTGQLAPFLEDLGVINPDLGYVSRVATTLRTRSKTLVEMAAAARFYFFDPRPYDPQAAGNFLTPASAQVLKEIESGLRRLEEVSETGLTLLLQEIAANTGQKLVNLAQPLRVALTGKSASPGLAEIIAVLGKDEVLCRIDQALDFINMGAAG